jgi:hypothetical protein
VKGQLLDHILHNEMPIFPKELTTSISSNTNTSSNASSRSASPIDMQLSTSDAQVRANYLKIRRRTALPSELLFGMRNQQPIMTQSLDANTLHVPSGSFPSTRFSSSECRYIYSPLFDVTTNHDMSIILFLIVPG